MTERTRLRTKLGAVASIFLVVVLVVVALSALMIRSWDRALDQRSAARLLSNDVTDLRLAYSDQETGIRGFRLSFDRSFLEPYRSGLSLAAAMERRIREREPGPVMEQRLDDVLAAADAWHVDVADVAIDPDTPLPADEIAKDRFDAVRDALDALDAVAASDVATAASRVDSVRRNAIGVLLASAAVAVVGTAFVMVLFRRWITRPLTEIVGAARRLATDDTTKMPDFEAAELQEVSDAVTSLQRSLRRERDRAVAAYEALEQSAVLALHVRSELAEALGEFPDGWDGASALHPAEGLVAGDCYDVALVDRRRLYVIMIDVTGHGASAALHALNAKAQLRAALRSRLAPGAALDWLAAQHRVDERPELLTAFVALVDVEVGTCEYAGAGHPPPMLTDGSTVELLEPTGPLLGAFDATWETRTVSIAPGSTLVVYTDGVTEALGPDRGRYGEDRLSETVRGAAGLSSDEALQQIVDDVDRFAAGEVRADDTTVVVLRRAVDTTGALEPLREPARV